MPPRRCAADPGSVGIVIGTGFEFGVGIGDGTESSTIDDRPSGASFPGPEVATKSGGLLDAARARDAALIGQATTASGDRFP
jgi:hypothetical protein